ncbi:ABC transporter ATP-binding protein [Dyadobacter sp. 3J3]|uniref:ABC transporter ATP-binding protein n=1 Tax=Dyadobacter sp. 3J3 TaxID=2606600 RepID=UPI00135CA8C2|nr:ATP-binding cassette domain-containing protein [Dyadobacter sp. 3J3]
MQNTEELIIETSHLSFAFSKGQNVLDEVNLKIPKGAIYGFLGPNGAGKTTTIRILLNLLKPGKGSVKLFGKQISEEPYKVFSQIGSLIETPSLYEHLTGLDNLLITANIRNISRNRVMEVLEIVGLCSDGDRHVKKYSLGMKQRLGLAIALLPSPDLLILDEPTNGLDPTGIIEIRNLLLMLNKEHGVTILISSHLLSEIEKLVSHLGILNHGKMLFQGSFSALQKIREAKSIIEIGTDQNNRALMLLEENNHLVNQGKQFLEIKFLDIYQVSAIAISDVELSAYQ